ncbi:hypothetical protein FQN57_000503 [Myotisia sp. PD_48]|nr:hypothetical protein FQN57_000503 [Myotisia sp. PD_48]
MDLQLTTRVNWAIFVLYFLQIFMSTRGLAAGFRISRARESSVTNSASKPRLDLLSLLHTNPAENNYIFSQALQLLDSMQQAPSCNQRAVASLITSCQDLSSVENEDGQFSGSDQDHIKSLYAARLAVCEITGTGAIVPEQCLEIISSRTEDISFGHSTETRPSSSRANHAISTKALERCLRCLESKPQWWTSYSNSRQNAAVMCQAARLDVEKEELLSQHRILTEVTFGLTKNLNQSLHNTHIQNSKQTEFLQSIERLRSTLLNDFRQDGAAAQSELRYLVQETRTVFQNVKQNFHALFEAALADADKLSKNINHSSQSIQGLKRTMHEAVLEVINRNSDSISEEKSALQANADLVAGVNRDLLNMKVLNTQVIVKEFVRLQASLAGYSSARLQQFDTSFDKFESKANTLQVVIDSYIVNHSQLQQSVQQELRVTHRIIQNITSSAMHLNSAIKDAQTLISRFNQLSGIVRSMLLPFWFALIFCGMMMYRPNITTILFLVCVGGMLFSPAGILDWIRNRKIMLLNTVLTAPHSDTTLVCILTLLAVVTILSRRYSTLASCFLPTVQLHGPV